MSRQRNGEKLTTLQPVVMSVDHRSIRDSYERIFIDS